MTDKIETDADLAVEECLSMRQSFALIAGAGAGKTRSLIDALDWIRNKHGAKLRQDGQRVACITFTKRAVQVIRERLSFDDLYLVSTLHSFLWDQIGRFQFDIRDSLRLGRIPTLIENERAKDNGGKSKAAREARAKVERLECELGLLDEVAEFRYRDAKVGDYSKGYLGHDDVIAIASFLFAKNDTFRRIVGLRFPYIFVDEAQDTFEGIVEGLNLTCAGIGLPLVGYFGDPWQQIYDGSVGDFSPPVDGREITKTENFRCSESVIRLLNAFRPDVQQHAAGDNRGREGSVVFRLVASEVPELERGRYSEDQIARASAKMDEALLEWGWGDGGDVTKLFLVRQMIARRMGFSDLNRLFTGRYASSRAQDTFEAGEHYLLLPLTTVIYPLVAAHEAGEDRRIIDILRRHSPAFSTTGPNAAKSLKSMVEAAVSLVEQIATLWHSGTIKDVLMFAQDNSMIGGSDRLIEDLDREPRAEDYDEEAGGLDKGDWLADDLFRMPTGEIGAYASFIAHNTAYSTQHGVKGEQYSKVMVVYDDVEANWNNYNFGKILTPSTVGEPTEGQRARGVKLAYVSFSRALEDLRVLFFTSNPQAAREELIARMKLSPEQIEVVH